MGRGGYILFSLAILLFAGWKLFDPGSQHPEPALADLAVDQPTAPSQSMKAFFDSYEGRHIVQEGDVLSSVFAGYEIPFNEIVGLQNAQSDNFRFTNIQVGKTVYFSLYPEGSDLVLKEVVYQPDSLRIIKAKQTVTGWIIEEEMIPYETRVGQRAGTVQESLYVSALRQGVDEKVILAFADVFAWDIDFALQTRSGDAYKVIYEERYLDGELVTTGRVLAAEYTNKGTVYRAFFFQEGEKRGYFDEEGNALQKAFLKAPVNYRYVTSGFTSARFHPILGSVMPHNGVDYAAAYGTPIIAVADGIVSRSGWQTGYGNRIELKHGDRYGTQYSHMSAYVPGLSVGDAVKQGDVIGYVGSTGYSTGNHVHYSVTDRGSYVDPSSIDVPDGEPVSDQYREEFDAMVAQRLSELESL